MKAIILVSLFVVGISAIPLAEQPLKVKYDNYKVYRFVPTNEAELEVLKSLETDFPGLLFWKRAGQVGHSVDVLIPPHLQPEILSGIQQTTTMAINEPLVSDVQKLIDEEEAANKFALAKAPKVGWEAYYSYDEIMEWLDEQAQANPSVATVETFGKSFEGRDLKVIKITTGGNGQKPIIWIDANIHAREWITNAVATYIVNELLNGETSGVRGLLDTFDFYVVPVMNPDGYQYTKTDRMWRKTRSNLAGGLCRGADPNRNYAFQWGTGGSSTICSSDTYRGVSAASEPETKASSALLDSIEDRVAAYLSLHSYSQLILIPYGNNLGRVPDHDNHMRVGRLVETAIAKRYGTKFTSGNIVEMLYVASGASVDYMKGKHDTTLSYTFELRDTGNNGFLLPPNQIIPSSLEFCDGLLALGNDLKVQLADKK